MNILSWLKGQFIHPEEGSNEMSESMNDEVVEQSGFSAEAAQMPQSAEVKVAFMILKLRWRLLKVGLLCWAKPQRTM